MHVAGATPLYPVDLLAAAYSCVLVHVRSSDFCPGDTDVKKKEERRRSTHSFHLKRTTQTENG